MATSTKYLYPGTRVLEGVTGAEYYWEELTGKTASSGTSVTTGVGALTLTGLAPTVRTPRAILAGVGALTLTGLAPRAVIGVRVYPGVASVTLTGLASTVQTPRAMRPGVGVLTLAGLAPTAAIGVRVAPGVGALVLAGLEPTVNATATPSTPTQLGGLIVQGKDTEAIEDLLTVTGRIRATASGASAYVVGTVERIRPVNPPTSPRFHPAPLPSGREFLRPARGRALCVAAGATMSAEASIGVGTDDFEIVAERIRILYEFGGEL